MFIWPLKHYIEDITKKYVNIKREGKWIFIRNSLNKLVKILDGEYFKDTEGINDIEGINNLEKILNNLHYINTHTLIFKSKINARHAIKIKLLIEWYLKEYLGIKKRKYFSYIIINKTRAKDYRKEGFVLVLGKYKFILNKEDKIWKKTNKNIIEYIILKRLHIYIKDYIENAKKYGLKAHIDKIMPLPDLFKLKDRPYYYYIYILTNFATTISTSNINIYIYT